MTGGADTRPMSRAPPLAAAGLRAHAQTIRTRGLDDRRMCPRLARFRAGGRPARTPGSREIQVLSGSRTGWKSRPSSRRASTEFLGEPDEQSFGPPDVAEQIRVIVLDHFAHELRAALAEPGERIVDVLHGEHDA
jgi:hypothetical protein